MCSALGTNPLSLNSGSWIQVHLWIQAQEEATLRAQGPGGAKPHGGAGPRSPSDARTLGLCAHSLALEDFHSFQRILVWGL